MKWSLRIPDLSRDDLPGIFLGIVTLRLWVAIMRPRSGSSSAPVAVDEEGRQEEVPAQLVDTLNLVANSLGGYCSCSPSRWSRIPGPTNEVRRVVRKLMGMR